MINTKRCKRILSVKVRKVKKQAKLSGVFNVKIDFGNISFEYVTIGNILRNNQAALSASWYYLVCVSLLLGLPVAVRQTV